MTAVVNIEVGEVGEKGVQVTEVKVVEGKAMVGIVVTEEKKQERRTPRPSPTLSAEIADLKAMVPYAEQDPSDETPKNDGHTEEKAVSTAWYCAWRDYKLVTTFLPAFLVHLFWWPYFTITESWGLFAENYFATITMIFGSFVAGATSEGGGAVAYPVFSLGFGIESDVARDFSLMIQSVGMTAAAFTIIASRTPVEWSALAWVTPGGIIGICASLEFIAPNIGSDQSKLFFVSTWASFAFALWLLNREHGRHVHDRIPDLSAWKRVALFTAGLIGGICSGIAGSGIDICSFSLLTLLFRVSEKVATPTSVVLMGINTCVGFWYQACGFTGLSRISDDAWNYWLVAMQVVPLGAPLGAFTATLLTRIQLAIMVYVLTVAQLFMGCIVILPKFPWLSFMAAGILLFGGLMFWTLSKLGARMLDDWLIREEGTGKPPLAVEEKGVDDQKYPEQL